MKICVAKNPLDKKIENHKHQQIKTKSLVFLAMHKLLFQLLSRHWHI